MRSSGWPECREPAVDGKSLYSRFWGEVCVRNLKKKQVISWQVYSRCNSTWQPRSVKEKVVYSGTDGEGE